MRKQIILFLFLLYFINHGYSQYIYDKNGNLACSVTNNYFYDSSYNLLGWISGNFVYHKNGSLLGNIDTTCSAHEVCFNKPAFYPFAYKQNNYVYLNSGTPFIHTFSNFYYNSLNGSYLGYCFNVDALNIMAYTVYFNAGKILNDKEHEPTEPKIYTTHTTEGYTIQIQDMPPNTSKFLIHTLQGQEKQSISIENTNGDKSNYRLNSNLSEGLYLVLLLDNMGTIVSTKKIYL